MVWWEAILVWIAGQILNYLLGKVTTEVEDAAAQAAADAKQGAIDAANTKAYDDAVSRQDRIKSALALLNGDAP